MPGDLQGQTRFAAATDSAERDQACRFEQRVDLGDLMLATDETGQRQPAGPGGQAATSSADADAPYAVLAGRWSAELSEFSFIAARQAKGVHEAIGRVAVRMSCAALELLDGVHAEPGPLGDTLLGEPELQAMGSQQVPE